MKFLRVIVLGLCLVGCTCGHIDRHDLNEAFEALRIGSGDEVNSERYLEKGSEKDSEEPNGLNNNERRCYANSTLQLLAAYFRKEIKNLPEYSDEKKKQLKASLLTVMDHINDKRKRNTGDKEVLEAVRNLTQILGTQMEEGGSTDNFLNSLDTELGFLPVYETVRYEYNFGGSLTCSGILCNTQMVPVKESCEKVRKFLDDEIFIPKLDNAFVVPVIDGQEGDSTPLKDMRGILDEVRELLQRWSQEPCINQRLDDLISVRNMQQRCQSVFDHLDGGNKEGSRVSYSVVLKVLKDRLSAGSKLLVHSGNIHKMGMVIPYGKHPWYLQKFDLVGFLISPGWSHVVAYIKRGGTWYEANDSSIRMVNQQDIDEVLDKCLKSFREPPIGLGYKYVQSLSIYEARN